MSQALPLESHSGQKSESLLGILQKGWDKGRKFERRKDLKNFILRYDETPENLQQIKMIWCHFYDNQAMVLADTCAKIENTGSFIATPLIKTLVLIDWFNTKIDGLLIPEAALADKRRKAIGAPLFPVHN